MSARTPLLSAISEGDHIPESRIAHFEQRVLLHFYDVVMQRFMAEKAASQLTKATLAKRINRGSDQVHRWLASPSNWTIATVARLLLGISGEEPILTTSPLAGRTPRNTSTMALLDEGDAPPNGRAPRRVALNDLAVATMSQSAPIKYTTVTSN